MPLRQLESDDVHEGWEKVKRAGEVLEACGIEIATDFQVLGTSQLAGPLAYADQHRLNKYGPMSEYRVLPDNNGSRLRSFHDLLQRRASVRKTVR